MSFLTDALTFTEAKNEIKEYVINKFSFYYAYVFYFNFN